MNAWVVLATCGPAAALSTLWIAAICRTAATADQQAEADIRDLVDRLAQQIETYIQFTAITSDFIPGDDQ